MKRTFFTHLRWWPSVVGDASNRDRARLGFVLNKLIPTGPIDDADAHIIELMSQYIYWKDGVTIEAKQLIVEQVSNGIELIARQGRIKEEDYCRMFPTLDQFQLKDGEANIDNLALNRSRACLLLNPGFMLDEAAKQDAIESKRAAALVEKVEKEQRKQLEAAAEQAAQDVKKQKKEAATIIVQNELFQCMNLSCPLLSIVTRAMMQQCAFWSKVKKNDLLSRKV